MPHTTYPKQTIALNENELSTDLNAIYLPDVVVPDYGSPLLQRRMRCRLLECLPGKVIPLHSHENRPALLYVLQGAGEECSNQFEGTKIWKEGDCFAELNNTEHWVRNLSDTTSLKILTFDLFDDKYPETAAESCGC